MIYVHSPTLILYYEIILLSKNLSTTCWPLESSLKTPSLTHTVYTGSSPLTCVFLLAFPNAGLHSYIRCTSCFHSCCRRATSLHFTFRKEWSSQAAPRNNCLNIIIHHHIGPHIQTPSPTATSQEAHIVFAHIRACPCFYVRLGGEWIQLNRFYCRTHSVLSANHFQSAQLSTSPIRMPLQPHNWNYLIGKLPSR